MPNVEPEPFKSWAVVEVMGHQEYAGYATAETIAGAAMLRVDVPETSSRPAFTKYIAPSALFGISPCSEQTARARAEVKRTVPFETWSVERQIESKLKEQGILPEPKAIKGPVISDNFDPDEDSERLHFRDDDGFSR